ncbi:ankyrin repeat-containing protein [Malassezia yamatoensis]|uniref:Ankyrin repeat-containing protein n=1 Tax=Malassezia yamatoensis TaxID=253288 RepID=A0AAJ5YZN6_9BASI|nr:ankyrin repeat-containing protein [Malassezia yamatoensis]
MAFTEEQTDDVLYAARAGDVEALQEIFSQLKDDSKCSVLHITNDQKNTPLHFAAANGHIDIVKMLLSEADLDGLLSQNTAGNTPLHWAALNGHLDVATAIVDRIEALELSQPEQAKKQRAAEDQRERQRHDATRVQGQSEEEIQQEHNRHQELQKDRALWDIRNEAGRGPMSEAQMIDREDLVQMLLGRLAQHDKQTIAESQEASSSSSVEQINTKTEQLNVS